MKSITDFFPLLPGRNVPKFESWDGLTHNGRDAERQAMATKVKNHLREIPPDPFHHDKQSYVTGANTRDNLSWLLYRSGYFAGLNLMTGEAEVFSLETGEPVRMSPAALDSMVMAKASVYRINEQIRLHHFAGLAEKYRYHPVKKLLDKYTWDNVSRVQSVLDCIPVRPEEQEKRNRLLTAFLVSAIVALDDGRVSSKIVPSLFSEQNDFHKTAFLRRLGDILPGAFGEGIAIHDPNNKDQTRKATLYWLVELGEVDQMSRRESGAIKAFIPLDEDRERVLFKDYYRTKPRQTVYAATVNIEDFIKDPTMSSRFPVIELTAPIQIDAVNHLLGWQRFDGVPVLTCQENLIQFWLEVRDLRARGVTHQLDSVTVESFMKSNDRHIDKGDYYSAVRELLLSPHLNIRDAETGEIKTEIQTHEGNGALFNASEICRTLNINSKYHTPVGKVLARLVREGVLIRVRGKTIRYRLAQKPE